MNGAFVIPFGPSYSTVFWFSLYYIQEFCQLSQTLQPQSRESFYKTLSSHGVLSGLEMTLQSTVKVEIFKTVFWGIFKTVIWGIFKTVIWGIFLTVIWGIFKTVIWGIFKTVIWGIFFLRKLILAPNSNLSNI